MSVDRPGETEAELVERRGREEAERNRIADAKLAAAPRGALLPAFGQTKDEANWRGGAR